MAKGQKRSNREAKKPKQDAKLKKPAAGMPENINPFGSGKKGGVAPHKSNPPKR
jgi:hypothetical protein